MASGNSPHGTSKLDQDGTHSSTRGQVGVPEHALDSERYRSRTGASAIIGPHGSGFATPRPVDTGSVSLR